MKKSKIEIVVELGEDKIPTNIQWRAQDANNPEWSEVQALFLSLFDKAESESLKMDLWTKDFRVDEMDKFVFQTLRTMADSYYRATNNSKMANHMAQFANFFGEETNIIKPENS
ncbi:gliding motility protein GldC [Membranihabitans marinus]|uniref:gliding motility protein GldC n=1 Tax=Membranihabitans marinus TaxID=1227546 RepID=UPI001F1A706B|nr:gliding motility protein GldC [Membranihabitans marinus]